MNRGHWVLACLLVGLCRPAAAQEISFGGQIRPRFEARDSADTDADVFTSMRVRAQLVADLERSVRLFIQLQDVRFFGEESNTLADFRADNFDLHQAYIHVQGSSGSARLAARAGRQELLFGGERLIGPVGWTQQGRAFDGLRLSVEADRARVDVIGAQLAEASSATFEDDAYFLGAYGVISNVGPGSLDVFSLFNRVGGATETDQLTLGARWSGEVSGFNLRGEASYQTGERSAVDVAAFMLGARAGTSFAAGSVTATLWYDYLSGDDDPNDDTQRVFDTLFATNHKFYGHADYFLNIPVQTAGRGLQDIAVKAAYRPRADVTLSADIHSFHLAKSEGLTTAHLGEEIDLAVTYRYSRNLRFIAGFSYLAVADAFGEIGRFGADASWGYAMLDGVF